MMINHVDTLGQHETTLDSVLFTKKRWIFLSEEVTTASAEVLIQQLLFLADQSRETITLFINSPGGVVSAGLGLIDVMERIQREGVQISTVAVGMAASMAAVILAAGTPGLRKISAHTEVMIHQVLGGAQGQATDVELRARQIRKVRDRLDSLLSTLTGQPIERIRLDTERDNYMSAHEAIEYGLADSIY